ncbi:MAG: hypothetical protein P4M11_02315 [Candidatus Pacebacteria bacterium]|nr:hypothetical protein [Candidatus Paceibacterota bacterium]
MSQSLATQVQDLTKTVRRAEKEYRKKLAELQDEPAAKETNGGKQFTEDPLNDSEAVEFGQMEQVAISRDAEIGNLVKGINDLAVIFKELSVLVIDQGNILDRIDYNIEQAVRHTKKANFELHKVL